MDIAISNWIYNTFGNSIVFANIAKMFTLLGNKWVIILIAAFVKAALAISPFVHIFSICRRILQVHVFLV